MHSSHALDHLPWFTINITAKSYSVLNGRYVIFPYVTIPNVTFPRVVKIPDIYTNPEIPKRLGEGERD